MSVTRATEIPRFLKNGNRVADRYRSEQLFPSDRKTTAVERKDRVESRHGAGTLVSFCFTHSRVEAEGKRESVEAAGGRTTATRRAEVKAATVALEEDNDCSERRRKEEARGSGGVEEGRGTAECSTSTLVATHRGIRSRNRDSLSLLSRPLLCILHRCREIWSLDSPIRLLPRLPPSWLPSIPEARAPGPGVRMPQPPVALPCTRWPFLPDPASDNDVISRGCRLHFPRCRVSTSPRLHHHPGAILPTNFRRYRPLRFRSPGRTAAGPFAGLLPRHGDFRS